MDANPTFIPNLAPNHNPVAALLVYLVEKAGATPLRRMRLRDAYADLDQSGMLVAAFVQMGGDFRGGENGVLWNQVRQHRLYVRDADSEIPGHATVWFRVPRGVAWSVKRVADQVPLIRTSPEDKQRDAIDIQMGRPVPDRSPKGMSPQHIKLALVGLAAAVETWNPQADEASGA